MGYGWNQEWAFCPELDKLIEICIAVERSMSTHLNGHTLSHNELNNKRSFATSFIDEYLLRS